MTEFICFKYFTFASMISFYASLLYFCTLGIQYGAYAQVNKITCEDNSMTMKNLNKTQFAKLWYLQSMYKDFFTKLLFVNKTYPANNNIYCASITSPKRKYSISLFANVEVNNTEGKWIGADYTNGQKLSSEARVLYNSVNGNGTALNLTYLVFDTDYVSWAVAGVCVTKTGKKGRGDVWILSRNKTGVDMPDSSKTAVNKTLDKLGLSMNNFKQVKDKYCSSS